MTTEQAYTAAAVAKMTGKSKQAITKRANKESWLYIETNGNGGKTKKYPLASLPSDIQNKFLEAHRHIYNKEPQKTCREGNQEMDTRQRGTASGGQGNGDEAKNLPTLYNKGRGEFVSLREILNPPCPPLGRGGENGILEKEGNSLVDWRNLPASCRDKSYDILNIVNRVREIQASTPRARITPELNVYAQSIGTTRSNLYRLLKKANTALSAAQKNGEDTIMAQISAVSPQHGRNKDRAFAFDKNAVIYAFSLYTTGQMRTMRDVYGQTVCMAQANNWQIGTYETLCNYLRRIDPATATLARNGKKAFEAAHLIKTLRNYDEIPPNFMWCGDHHIFDVFVKLPDGKGGWNFKRPWVTMWMDMRSRSFMGWCISFKPNSRTIGMALAHAISPKNDPDFPQCGLPSSVYIDNGKDYRAKYLNGEDVPIGRIDYPDIMERFAALGIDPFYIDLEFDAEQNAWVKKHGDKFIEIKNVRIGGVYARLGIGQRYATAYHPWAKPVERAFRTVVQSFSRELPGWCGSGHEQRPEKLAFELKSGHQILTIEEFCDRFYGWVVNKYHTTAHRGHGMNGMTPNEAFTSLMPAPETCEPQILDFALLKKEHVKIHNWGFNLHGRQFELDLPANIHGGSILNILVGQWATIFHDYDFKAVRVYRDETWVCNARPLNRASFVTPNDAVMVEKLKLASHQKRAATGFIASIHEHPAAREDVNEAAALLALTQGATSRVPLPEGDKGGGPLQRGTTENEGESSPASVAAQSATGEAATQPAASCNPACPVDDEIYVTRPERYRNQIQWKIARGLDLTPEQQTFRESFEESKDYLDSQELHETYLEYEKYRAGGQS